MNFKQYMNLQEAGPNIPWGYMGPLTPIIGGDRPERLNYGSSGTTFSRSAMLYVKIDPKGGAFGALAKKARREMTRWGIECLPSDKTTPATAVSTQWDDRMTVDGGMYYRPIDSNWQCKMSNNQRKHYASVKDTGEFHVTIGQYFQLKPLFEAEYGSDFTVEQEIEFLSKKTLGGQPLFQNNVGIEMPISIPTPSKIVYGLAPSFEGEPVIAITFVECPRGNDIRKAVGLPPVDEGYLWHITIATAFPTDSQLPDGREIKTTNLKELPKKDRSNFQTADKRHDQGYFKVSGATGVPMKQKQELSQKENFLPEGFVYLGQTIL